jgi:hypothetical protein
MVGLVLLTGALGASVAWDLWRLARHARWPEVEVLVREVETHPLLWGARVRHEVRNAAGETWDGSESYVALHHDPRALLRGRRLRRRHDPADRARIVEVAPARTAGQVGLKLGLAGFAWAMA